MLHCFWILVLLHPFSQASTDKQKMLDKADEERRALQSKLDEAAKKLRGPRLKLIGEQRRPATFGQRRETLCDVEQCMPTHLFLGMLCSD